MNYFSEDELRCKCGCDVYLFDESALSILNSIRHDCGFPLPVSSGYRCKSKPGAHTTGKAVDLAVSRGLAHTVLRVAFAHGVPRIGVNQKGDSRFIHLDWCDDCPNPTVWSY